MRLESCHIKKRVTAPIFRSLVSGCLPKNVSGPTSLCTNIRVLPDVYRMHKRDAAKRLASFLGAAC
jgi:hypothetical protein